MPQYAKVNGIRNNSFTLQMRRYYNPFVPLHFLL